MCRHSEEGNVDCLGIFDTNVVKFHTDDKSLKIPQMGWNNINELRSELFHGLEDGSYAYFIHSYHVPINEHTAAVTDYIHPYSSALHKDNYYATQFHPEKSGKVGEMILRNFIERCSY
jgi:glutamine amidotransferase